MPTRARRTCPRCRTAGPPGTPCQVCASRRPQTTKPFSYNDAAWKANRAAFLAEHPTCALCTRPSRIADHYPIARRDLVAQGVADPDAWTHLRPLCVHHHATETAARQPGGWNRDRET
jgi:5-methylcytosine-specific restriction protein A